MSRSIAYDLREVQRTTDAELILKLRADKTESGLVTMKAAAGIAVGNLAVINASDVLVSPYAMAENKGGTVTTGTAEFHRLLVQNYLFDSGDLARTLGELEAEGVGRFLVSGNVMIMQALEDLSVYPDESVQRGLYSLAKTALAEVWTPRVSINQPPASEQ